MNKKVFTICVLCLACVALSACNSNSNPQYGVVLSNCTISNRSGAVQYMNFPVGYYVEILSTDESGKAILDENGDYIIALYITQDRQL